MIWISNPRFLDRTTRLGFDLRRAVRLRRIYEQGGGRQQQGGFSVQRDIAALRLNHEFERWFRVGAALELIHDSFSLRFIDEQSAALQRENFGGPPPPSRIYMPRWFTTLGRVDADDFYVDGASLTGGVGHTSTLWGATHTFSELSLAGQLYKRLPWRSNLAFRADVGLTNTDLIQYFEFIGGLNRVRGYPDSLFQGRGAWSANAEYRIAPLATRWMVLQTVGFVDAGATVDRGLPFDELDALSVGFGLRVISPKIYSLIARFDYAVPLTPGGRPGLSFGAVAVLLKRADVLCAFT